MALLNTDLFVIQRPTDDGKHFKLTGEKLKEYIAASDTIVYKGSRDFTQAAQDPSTDGTGVNTGDIYINNHPNAAATGGWAANIFGEEVDPGDRAIWNGTSWDLLHESSDKGVTDINGIEPIEVDDATPGEPIISVNAALETSAAMPIDRASRSGVVPSIAVAGDVSTNPGNASPNPEAVVPADLLKDTNEAVVLIEANIDDIEVIVGDGQGITGSLTENIVNINQEITNINQELEDIADSTLASLKGEDPIEVVTALIDDTAVDGDAYFGKTQTTVSIKDGTTVQKGAVQLQETGSAVASSNTVAATPAYVGAYYLVKDFSSFGDA
jgi:hypothetical protein